MSKVQLHLGENRVMTEFEYCIRFTMSSAEPEKRVKADGLYLSFQKQLLEAGIEEMDGYISEKEKMS